MSSISRAEIVAVAALKKFRRMILNYNGSPEQFRSHLLRELDKLETKGDEILEDLMDEIL